VTKPPFLVPRPVLHCYRARLKTLPSLIKKKENGITSLKQIY
jgi:hypothetical protein